MGDEYVVDAFHFVEDKITDARSGIEQHVVEQHGGGVQVRTDSASTPQNFQLPIKMNYKNAVK
ncbi:hypothetical protein ACFOFO_15605 [Undibacterium arcticum]|uniref:Uncharacterized protein n=1 Tax=Undibacterium arcticum TaxID=1762892 RepID=A0ABV7F2T2_9BURK